MRITSKAGALVLGLGLMGGTVALADNRPPEPTRILHARSAELSCLDAADERDHVCAAFARALGTPPEPSAPAVGSCIDEPSDPVCAAWARFLSE